jgi:Uncharacterised nucleotidyltransferase
MVRRGSSVRVRLRALGRQVHLGPAAAEAGRWTASASTLPALSSEIAEESTVAAARTLLLDAVAAECISVLRAEDIRAILLKGPVTARWLYSEREVRDYVDVDLLVAPDQFRPALGALAALGYRDTQEKRSPNEIAPHAHLLVLEQTERGGSGARFPAGTSLDLHWSFHGIGATDKFWPTIAARTERLRISGLEVEVPDQTTRALLIALHAATSGPFAVQALADLDRALARVPTEAWKSAYDLAERLDAVPRFVAGLAMRPAGRELVRRVYPDGRIDVASALRVTGIPPVAGGLERLRMTSGARGKARLLARELVPSRSFMRMWSPLAARGMLGLALAYAYRPLWLAAKLPTALRARARARRVAASGQLSIDGGDDQSDRPPGP